MNDSIHIDSSKNISCPMKAEVVPLIHTNNLFFFKFYFIFKLYIIVLVLPNIKMNPPQV